MSSDSQQHYIAETPDGRRHYVVNSAMNLWAESLITATTESLEADEIEEVEAGQRRSIIEIEEVEAGQQDQYIPDTLNAILPAEISMPASLFPKAEAKGEGPGGAIAPSNSTSESKAAPVSNEASYSTTQNKGLPKKLKPIKGRQDTLKELLQIVFELLQQHEVRLCLLLLDEFCKCEPLGALQLDADGLDIWRVTNATIESHLSQNGSTALQHLLHTCKKDGTSKKSKKDSAFDVPDSNDFDISDCNGNRQQLSNPLRLSAEESGSKDATEPNSCEQSVTLVNDSKPLRRSDTYEDADGRVWLVPDPKPIVNDSKPLRRSDTYEDADGRVWLVPEPKESKQSNHDRDSMPRSENSEKLGTQGANPLDQSISGSLVNQATRNPSLQGRTRDRELQTGTSDSSAAHELPEKRPSKEAPKEELTSEEERTLADEKADARRSLQLSCALATANNYARDPSMRASQSSINPYSSGTSSTETERRAKKRRDSQSELHEAEALALQYNDGNPDSAAEMHLLAIKSAWYIIHPNSKRKLRWDLLGVVFIVTEAFLVPLALGFDIEPDYRYFWLATSYFAVDILSQFITGFYKEGWLVMKQAMIIKHYLTGFFPIDFLATMPWDLILGGGGAFARIARVGKLLRLTRLVRILKLGALIEQIEDLMPAGSAALMFSLVKILMMFALLCHWTACVWGFIGSPKNVASEYDGLPPHNLDGCEPGGVCEPGFIGSPWQRRSGLDNYESKDRYLVSLQFATGLLTGSDPGLVAGHLIERIFMILMMVVAFLLAALVLGQIVATVEEMSSEKKELTHRLRCAKEFMAAKKVPLSLQAKVKRYLEHQAKVAGEAQLQNQEFKEHLSTWIKLELMEHMNGKTIGRHPFFKELPRAVLQLICGITTTESFAPGDIVMQRGHRATTMYWVVKGKLRIMHPKALSHNESYHSLTPQLSKSCEYQETMSAPCWIGDACLFKEMTRPRTAISMTHSELLMLEKHELIDLLTDYPRSIKYFNEWTEKMTYEGGVGCDHCTYLGHTVDMCPQTRQSQATNPRKTAVRRSYLKKTVERVSTWFSFNKKTKPESVVPE